MKDSYSQAEMHYNDSLYSPTHICILCMDVSFSYIFKTAYKLGECSTLGGEPDCAIAFNFMFLNKEVHAKQNI